MAAAVPYGVLLTTIPSWFRGPADPGLSAGIGGVLKISVMVVGGILGLLSIALAADADRIRNGRALRMVATGFACMGLCAEVVYIRGEGIHSVLSNLFIGWALVGPLIVGAHFAYAAFRGSRSESQL